MKLRPYPEYKGSGVPWLEKVPSHWDPQRLKSRIHNVVSLTKSTNTTDVGLALENVESWTGKIIGIENQSGFDSQVKRFSPNDILFAKLRPYLAKVARPEFSGICVGEFLVLRTASKTVNPAFVEWLLRSKSIINVISASTYGAKMPRAEWQFIGSLKCVFPSLREQTQIARFLDWKTAQIDRFIHNKRRLVELLKEQKQVLINQAVTGAIDVHTGKPYPEYKDSGVPWLGKVPSGWNIKRLKFLCRNVNQQTSEKAPDEAYIALENVESWTGRITFPDGEITFDSLVKKFKPGDILFGKLRPYLAKVTRPSMSGVCVGEFLVLRLMSDDLLGEFLEYKLRSNQIINLVNSSTYGAKMPRADWTFIGNIRFSYPSRKEQEAIVSFIQRISKSIDTAITRAQREIDLIQEYRTRLIADVVTGKLDVRDVEVPEVDESEEALGESVITGDAVAQDNLEVAM